MANRDEIYKNLQAFRQKRLAANAQDMRLPPGHTRDADGTYRDADGNFVWESDIVKWRKANPVGTYKDEGKGVGDAIRNRNQQLQETG